MRPVIVPAVVICMNNTRDVPAAGIPFTEPFNKYQAPPVKSLMDTFWPAVGVPAVNIGFQRCKELSMVDGADCGGTAALEIPIVTQLSAARVGKNEKINGLIPPAVSPVANVSL
jgi:hypothetical protein